MTNILWMVGSLAATVGIVITLVAYHTKKIKGSTESALLFWCTCVIIAYNMHENFWFLALALLAVAVCDLLLYKRRYRAEQEAEQADQTV